MSKKMYVLNIRIDEETKDNINKLAAELITTKSDAVRFSIQSTADKTFPPIK
jgi:antitoxin component of RelBE/YafQ-DinJ toxin-antitoxin module